MKKIYIVRGETGSWEDYRDWNVMAFPTKEKAEQYRNKVQEENERSIIEYGTIY